MEEVSVDLEAEASREEDSAAVAVAAEEPERAFDGHEFKNED